MLVFEWNAGGEKITKMKCTPDTLAVFRKSTLTLYNLDSSGHDSRGRPQSCVFKDAMEVTFVGSNTMLILLGTNSGVHIRVLTKWKKSGKVRGKTIVGDWCGETFASIEYPSELRGTYEKITPNVLPITNQDYVVATSSYDKNGQVFISASSWSFFCLWRVEVPQSGSCQLVNPRVIAAPTSLVTAVLTNQYLFASNVQGTAIWSIDGEELNRVKCRKRIPPLKNMHRLGNFCCVGRHDDMLIALGVPQTRIRSEIDSNEAMEEPFFLQLDCGGPIKGFTLNSIRETTSTTKLPGWIAEEAILGTLAGKSAQIATFKLDRLFLNDLFTRPKRENFDASKPVPLKNHKGPILAASDFLTHICGAPKGTNNDPTPIILASSGRKIHGWVFRDEARIWASF